MASYRLATKNKTEQSWSLQWTDLCAVTGTASIVVLMLKVVLRVEDGTAFGVVFVLTRDLTLTPVQ